MNESIPDSSPWGLAAIIIVVASWLFYRYFAPKTWRDEVSAVVLCTVEASESERTIRVYGITDWRIEHVHE